MNTLKVLHDAILAGLRAALPPEIQVLESPDYAKRLPLPCVVLEISALDRSTDPADGRFARRVRCDARVVVDPLLAHAQLQVRELALNVGRIVQHQVWGLEERAALSSAQVGDIDEDGMKPELDSYLVWLTPWSHHVHFDAIENGASGLDWQTVFIPDGHGGGTIADYPESLQPKGSYSVTDSETLLGLYPETGTGREDRYWPIGEEPPPDWGEMARRIQAGETVAVTGILQLLGIVRAIMETPP